MSTEINTRLIEEAQFHCDYWEGTIWAEIIRYDLETNDLELLKQHLKESQDEMWRLEYNPEPLEDEVY